MLITQPRRKKNQNGPRASLKGPEGAVWGEKPTTKRKTYGIPYATVHFIILWRQIVDNKDKISIWIRVVYPPSPFEWKGWDFE